MTPTIIAVGTATRIVTTADGVTVEARDVRGNWVKTARFPDVTAALTAIAPKHHDVPRRLGAWQARIQRTETTP